MLSLSGRVAAITGASAGIGASCARHFAGAGLAVSLAARRADRLEQVARGIADAGGRAMAVSADVTSEADMRAFVTRTLAAFGRLDVLVANAGIGFHGTLEDTTPDVMQRLHAVNVMGTLNVIRAALPHFEAQGSGHILIVSSIVGRRGIPVTAGYCATKFAQVGIGEALRAELRGTGIHVSLVFPVGTETEFHDAMGENFGFQVAPVGPRQSPDTVAEAMLRCVRRPRPEVYPHAMSRALTILNAVAPGLCDRVVLRYARHRVRSARHA
jgi:NADP-dependent 3-hydroxy acid dehydrogenase YdfG